jgi:hypothetical protein
VPKARPNEPAGLSPLAHHEVLALALLELGGDRQFIDIEHVAVEASRISPGRFTWVHYPDQINIHNIKTCLWKAKADPQGGYFLGSDAQGWMLTERGADLARSLTDRLGRAVSARSPANARQKHWLRGERARLLASDAFRHYSATGVEAVTIPEMEAFFRLNDYVSDDARDRKITRLVNTFRDDPQLGPVVVGLAERLRSRQGNARQ